MILLSHLTGLHEFMFPEGISVVLGVWAVERQPWRVNKAQLFFMMIIGSICAVCIVKYLPIPLIFQVLIGFILVGISLLVTKTSFAPVVSAFMLPILLQSDSWLFPLLVIGYIGVIIAVQTLYQKTGLTQKTVSSHTSFQWKMRTVPLVHSADYFLYIIHLSYSNPQYLFYGSSLNYYIC